MASLARAQGRNATEEEYARFLRLEGAAGWVLEREGGIVAAGTAIRYFEHGFLGPIVAGPEDASGLAIALLSHMIERLQRDGAVWIEAEAGPVEEPILARMGFVRVRGTRILERGAESATEPSASARFASHHLLDVGVLDASVAGHGRKEYLEALARDHPEGARVIESDGEVVGFALLRRGAQRWQLGPVVTRRGDEAAARALVSDALAACDGPVVALAAEEERVLAMWRREGFHDVGSLARMRAGVAPPVASDVATEWAVGGRLTG